MTVVWHGNFALQNMEKRKGIKNNNNGLHKDKVRKDKRQAACTCMPPPTILGIICFTLQFMISVLSGQVVTLNH